MNDREKPARSDPLAGGVFLVLGMIVGVVAGVIVRQPSAGLLIGLAAGGLAALIVALRSRR